ncbi:MAG: hypothetical protein L3J20_09105 [Flavobacteriaceae bacterium]|nr:hypothetical protein [Flavobacteriaceae bacterium]
MEKVNLLNTNNIPEIPILIKKLKALAMLDAILMPDWNYRYYSFDSTWDNNEMMASMRNGSGDHYFILFKEEGAIIKEFQKDSTINKNVENSKIIANLTMNLPKEFQNFITEPAFKMDEITFLSWRLFKDSNWNVGNLSAFDKEDINSLVNRIDILVGDYNDYIDWAEEYYEVEIDKIAVNRIFDGETLTDEMITRLNPEISKENLEEDILEIGYSIV